MKFLIILVLSVSCLDLAFSSTASKGWLSRFLPKRAVDPSLSFKASTVTTPAFDAKRKIRDDFINKLPPIQREVLFTLLTGRGIRIGAYESKRRDRHDNRRAFEPINNIELILMEQVATKKGYEQLLNERPPSPAHSEERSVLGVNNIWKINLSAVMPQTAALADEDFIVSANYRKQSETVTETVMSLVATGHEDVVAAFKNSTPKQSSSILQGAVRRYYLKDGEESLVQRFTDDLNTKNKLLQNFYQTRTERKEGNNQPHGNTAEEETKEIARREKEIAEMEQLVGKVDAIAEFYVSKSLQQYNEKVERIAKVEHIALHVEADPKGKGFLKTKDRIIPAEIDDLGLYGWLAFKELTSLLVYYDNFFELLAQEVEASRALKP